MESQSPQSAVPTVVTDEDIRRSVGRPPVSGAWRDGDPVAWRQFASVGKLHLEFGSTLPDVRIAYETWGELNADRSNAVLILPALTGDAHVIGAVAPGQPTPGWWPGLVGPGEVIDTDRYFVVCPNALGGCQGTTGPASLAPDDREWGSRFPFLSIRDQVTAQLALTDWLGIDRWFAIVGGSMGAMHSLEWSVTYPDRVARCAIIAAPAQTRAEHIAFNSVQIQVVSHDPDFLLGDYYDLPPGRGPYTALALARRMALTKYRGAQEFDERFGRQAQSGLSPLGEGGRFSIESYLDYHGNKFTRRFDANSYVRLLAAINSHDVGRGRGGIDAALGQSSTVNLVVGIDSDRLYDVASQDVLAAGLPRVIHEHKTAIVHSPHGHDSFLIEHEQVGAYVAELFATEL